MEQNPKYDQHSHFLPLKWSCNPSCRSLFVLTQHWATASVLLAMEVSSEDRSASSCEGWDLHRAVSASLAASMSALCCWTMPCRSWKAMERLYVYSQEELHSGGKSKSCDACWMPLWVGSRDWLKRMMLWCRKGKCHKSEEKNQLGNMHLNNLSAPLKVRVYLILGTPESGIHRSYVFCYFLFLSYSQRGKMYGWMNYEMLNVLICHTLSVAMSPCDVAPVRSDNEPSTAFSRSVIWDKRSSSRCFLKLK